MRKDRMNEDVSCLAQAYRWKSVTAEPGTDEYKDTNDEPYVAPSRNVILHLAPRYSHGPR